MIFGLFNTIKPIVIPAKAGTHILRSPEMGPAFTAMMKGNSP